MPSAPGTDVHYKTSFYIPLVVFQGQLGQEEKRQKYLNRMQVCAAHSTGLPGEFLKGYIGRRYHLLSSNLTSHMHSAVYSNTNVAWRRARSCDSRSNIVSCSVALSPLPDLQRIVVTFGYANPPG